MTAHAKLRPSAAARWLACTMAPTMEAGFEEKPSEYAAEGSRAHKLVEYLIRTSVGLPWEEDKIPKADDAEMQDAAEECAAYVKETYLQLVSDCADTYIDTEVRLDLTDWIPESYGTADVLIVADEVLYVIDFKYGKGVKVEAEYNRQMMIYALGAMDWALMLYDIKQVNMVIVQPRLGSVSDYQISTDTLADWGETFLRPKAKAAFDGEGKFAPGEDTCRFCRASGHCKAQADYYIDLFEDNEDPDLITPLDAGSILERAQGMRKWLEAVEGIVYGTLMNGGEVEGWKLVEGRSTRKYTDEAEIEKRLRAKRYKVSDIYEKKMIGITKMEKLLGKKVMNELIGDLIEKPRGAAVLAPASDKRPEYTREDEIMEAFDD